MNTYSSFRDPENFVIFVEGRWFRVCNRSSATALIRLLELPLYEDLLLEGQILSYRHLQLHEASKIIRAIEGDLNRPIYEDPELFEVETVEVVSYPWEWPNSLLRSAARLTLSLRLKLLEVGLDLKDASALNIQFRGSRPLLMDLGSIEIWRPNPTWNAFRQFVEHFINPLAVGSSPYVTSSDAWRLSNLKGLGSKAARSMMPRKLRRNLPLKLIHYSTYPRSGNQPIELRYSSDSKLNPELALQASRSLTRRLQRIVSSLDCEDHRTTWASYGNREHYKKDALEAKYGLTASFVRSVVKGQGVVLDIGGNDGHFGKRLAEELNLKVLVMDVDGGALDGLTRDLGEESVRLTPIVGDLTNPFPSSGLLSQEFLSFNQRVHPDVVVCQAVLHHVVITQGVPISLAVAALESFGCPVQIEFASEKDPKVQILLSQIPNWSGSYSLELLMNVLKSRFERAEIVGKTTESRFVVNAY